MDENTTVVQPEIDFDDGWNDDADIFIEADQPKEEPVENPEAEPPKEEAPAAPEPEKPAEEKPETPADQKPEAQPEADQPFVLKHLDEVKTVNRDEVITLAQKGLDYDRTKGQLSQAKEQLATYEAFLKELAAPQSLTIEQLMDRTRAAMIAKRDNVSEEDAMRTLALQKREQAVADKEAKLQQEQATQSAADAAKEKRAADIRAFLDTYKDVDPQKIPTEVWADVSRGMPLTAAYAKFENKQLKEKLAAMEQQAKNKEKSTGSVSTAGGGKKMDDWERDWYADD